MDERDLRVLSAVVEHLKGQEFFPRVVARLEGQLALSADPFVWAKVNLDSLGAELPQGVRSCWIFHLKRDVPTGAHRHPNSVQHTVVVRGRGTSVLAGVRRPIIPFGTPGASLASQWLVIDRDVAHEFIPDGADMTVVSFHTCDAAELQEIDCESGRARFYEASDA